MAKASDYGRNVGTAQRGEGYDAYKWDAKDAKEYLTGAETTGYEDALGKLNIDPRYKKRKIHNIGDYTRQARGYAEDASKYRDVAGRRAFGEYQEGARPLSKPWMRKAEGGLLKERTVDFSLAGLEDLGGEKSHIRHSWESRQPGVTEEQARDALRGDLTFRGRGIAEGRAFGEQMSSLERSQHPGDPVSPMGTRQLPWSEYMRNRRGPHSTYGRFTTSSFSPMNKDQDKTRAYLGQSGLPGYFTMGK